MDGLQVAVGAAARTLLCDAFKNAHHEIDAEFFSISEPDVIASLNKAAAQDSVHVRVHVEAHPDRYQKRSADSVRSDRVSRSKLSRLFSKRVEIVFEDDPLVLMHAKAAVVDGATAFIGTANPTRASFENPGAVVVKDTDASDVAALVRSIEHQTPASSDHLVVGPTGELRARIGALFASSHDLSIASEDLSDPAVVSRLVERCTQGHQDRVLVGDRASVAQKRAVSWLEHEGVDVRMLAHGYMHEKYVDDGDAYYVGSANLTHNGLDESHEAGIVATVACSPQGAAALRADFEQNWSNSVSARYRYGGYGASTGAARV